MITLAFSPRSAVTIQFTASIPINFGAAIFNRAFRRENKCDKHLKILHAKSCEPKFLFTTKLCCKSFRYHYFLQSLQKGSFQALYLLSPNQLNAQLSALCFAIDGEVVIPSSSSVSGEKWEQLFENVHRIVSLALLALAAAKGPGQENK
jgi:hypothetical protein